MQILLRSKEAEVEESKDVLRNSRAEVLGNLSHFTFLEILLKSPFVNFAIELPSPTWD
jgi:hypothetical protein